MSWQFVIHPRASDQLAALPPDVDERIRQKLKEMVTSEWRELHDYDVEHIRGCDHEIYRTRIGEYRVFFLAEKPVAAILHVAKRGRAYRSTEQLDSRADDFETG